MRTASITATANAARAHRGPAVLAAGAAVLLALLAMPIALSALQRLPGDTTLARVRLGQPVTPAELNRLWDSRQNALAQRSDGSLFADMAVLHLQRARQLPAGSAERQQALDEAAVAAERSLAHDPGSAFVWLTLAEAQLLLQGLGPAAAPALQQSIAVGPYVSPIALRRLDLALILERHLDARGQVLLDGQIRAVAAWKPRQLAELARQRYALRRVRAALLDHPAELAAFDRAYSGLR